MNVRYLWHVCGGTVSIGRMGDIFYDLVRIYITINFFQSGSVGIQSISNLVALMQQQMHNDNQRGILRYECAHSEV